MIDTCSYCSGPLAGTGLRGRPWPGREPGCYCCFGCLSLGEEDAAGTLRKHRRELGSIGWRLGAGVLLTGQSMLLGLGVNLAPPDEPAVTRLLQGLVLACTVAVVALLGGPLFRNALHEFRRVRVSIETLFVLTMTGAMIASLQSFLSGTGPIYFETVSVLLVVYTIGKLIGARGRAEALARSRVWSGELARCRLVDERGRTHDVEAASVLPGDIAEVRPGETIAVDGVIERGTGFVCEAARTGEPFAAVRRPGDGVLAGCIAEDAVFLVRATAPGTERQVDRFLDAVEEARSSPTSLQGQADRLARVFVPVVVAVSLGTFLFWTRQEDWRAGLFNAMAVLLVACPCALGLATPIVVWSALGRLAERGLITRQGSLIEQLATIDHVVFDKTGTLTEDHFALVDIAVLENAIDRARLLRWLAAVESRSSHPIARAFLDVANPEQVRLLAFRVVPGCGLEAEIEEDGERHTLRIGGPDWLRSAERPDYSTLLASLKAAGHRIDVEVDGRLVALAVVAERLRESTRQAMADLRDLGIGIEVMTGDTTEQAADLLRLRLGEPDLRIESSVSPEEKQQRLRQRMGEGARPLFVGDGINDAAALATATAGIALASGTDLAVSASTATLYGGDLRAIPWAVALSRQAVRIARTTILWADGYNLAGMTLAALGLLHPIAAALLMTASSLWVAWMSSRLGRESCHIELRPVPPPSSSFRWNPHALVQVIALALQGMLVIALLGLDGMPALGVMLAFLLAGMILALLGRADLDMLTLGTLGMLAGWWMDQGWRPLAEGCPCCCTAGASLDTFTTAPAMWLGMLLGNLPLLWQTRSSRRNRLALLVVSNSGMIIGMMLGGAAAGLCVAELGWPAAPTSLAGMTLGMLAGHLPCQLFCRPASAAGLAPRSRPSLAA
jgi:heavy metal translocating P-type ATPase